MGARELQARTVNSADPKLESFRAWEAQATAALEEIEELEAVLEIVDRLTQNGDGLWKSRYLWIFVLFSLLQIIPLTIYLLR
jgi:hypothetical protein